MNNTDFIQPTLEAIKSNLDAIRSLQESKKGMSFAETAQIFLMDKLGYTQIQAQEVYEELEKGLAEYTAQHEAVMTDEAAVTASIIDATANYSPEERTNIYINVLTSLQLIDEANADTDVELLREKNGKLSDEELVSAIVSALDSLPFQYVMDGIKDGISPEIIAAMGDTKAMHAHDFKIAAAVILYAAQKEGKIDISTDDVELSPRVIGGMAAAGADAMSATCDLQEGKINLPSWQAVIKCIFKALFSMAFAAICTLAILTVNAIIASVLFSVFGIGLFATLLIIPAMYYFTKAGIKTSEEEYAKMIEKYSMVYDSVMVKLEAWSKVVIAKIKAWMQVAREKVVEAASNIKAPKQSATDDNTVTDANTALA